MRENIRQHLVNIWNRYYKNKLDPIRPEAPVIKNIDVSSVKLYDENGTVITRWKFDLLSRILLLLTGNLYIYCHTFNKPEQPIYLDGWRPDLADPEFNKKLEIAKTVEFRIEQKYIQTKDFMKELIDEEFKRAILG